MIILRSLGASLNPSYPPAVRVAGFFIEERVMLIPIIGLKIAYISEYFIDVLEFPFVHYFTVSTISFY
jgi:hypothetical protein